MNRTRQTLVLGWVVLLLVGVAGAADAQAAKTLLRLRVNGPMLEAPPTGEGLQALLAGEPMPTLYEWVTTMRQAAADDEIDGLALIIEQPEVGLAQAEEMTRAIREFKAHGKPVYAYIDYAGNIGFVLAAAADHITLAENSELGVMGLYAEASYYKGLLDKIGVEMDGMHCGAYKSALESFTRSEPSPEAAENINWLLDGIYERWVELIAEGRHLSVEQVRKLIDQAPLNAAQALDAKLVDEVSSFDAFAQRMRKEFGDDVVVLKEYEEGVEEEIDWENPFAMFELFSKMMEGPDESEDPGVALIYIDGPIMVGENEPSLLGGVSAGSTTIRAALEKAQRDEKIKAVVLRVDSPGGSALASDIMWKAAVRCGKAKPLIVSMGGVAGSGGYYVSLPGDTVFAEASTLTGSIGVVGGKLVLKGLMEDKLGITSTPFARGRNSGLMTTTRKWDDRERQVMRDMLDRTYDQFKGRVQESRGKKLKGDLEGMAGGRVFTGTQALERGLVDQIGGLTDALALARKKAGVGDDAPVYVLPKPSEFSQVMAMLEDLMGAGEDEDDFEIDLSMSAPAGSWLRAALPLIRQMAPEQVADMTRALQNLLVLDREHVGCFMPFVPRVR